MGKRIEKKHMEMVVGDPEYARAFADIQRNHP